MSTHTCADVPLLVQADLDGELSPAEAAQIVEHIEMCPECAALPAQLIALSERLRQGVSYYAAPEPLRIAVLAQLTAMQGQALPPSRLGLAPRAPRPSLSSWLRARTAIPFGAGFALAACLAFALLLPPAGDRISEELVFDHIRALQPGHLMDVVSTDQHTVKPWFDGRLDFAPPVKDLQAKGFPLAGGRLDYLAGRPVAVLVYQRRQHIIDVYVWPGRSDPGPVSAGSSGYNVVRWNQNDMAFSAVSDLDPRELAEFVRDLQGA